MATGKVTLGKRLLKFLVKSPYYAVATRPGRIASTAALGGAGAVYVGYHVRKLAQRISDPLGNSIYMQNQHLLAGQPQRRRARNNYR